MDGILDMVLADLKRSLDDRYRPDPDNYFGDVGGDAGNDMFATALEIAKSAGSDDGVYGMLPDSMTGGVMDPVNRGLSAGGDLGLAALLAGYGGFQKAVGYGSEILAGPTTSEERAYRDIIGGLEAAGFGSGARTLSALQSHFAPFAAKRASRINVPGVTPDNRAGILGFLDDYRSEMHRELNRGR